MALNAKRFRQSQIDVGEAKGSDAELRQRGRTIAYHYLRRIEDRQTSGGCIHRSQQTRHWTIVLQ
jgi:hypothetical protein